MYLLQAFGFKIIYFQNKAESFVYWLETDTLLLSKLFQKMLFQDNSFYKIDMFASIPTVLVHDALHHIVVLQK